MRWVCTLLGLALFAGASPALAQPDIGSPNPVEQAPAVKKHRAVRKVTPPAAKPQAATSPAVKPEVAKAEPAGAAPAKIEPAQAGVAPAAPAAADVARLAPAERQKIQSALYWAGDYASVSGPDAMDAAIRSFQKRNKSKITGVLTAEQRAALVAAADSHEQEFGWRVVVDPATGVRIGLPSKLVPVARDAAHGTHWSSPHGEVQVETFRIKDKTLAALFEQEKKQPDTRKIERSVLNDDGFIVSGMQGLKYFTVRAKQRDGEVRGFTLYYDQMMEGIVAPAMVAMASAFSPFPERPAPFATLAKKVEYGTGLIVGADGFIVTARRLAQGCEVIVADTIGNAERVAEDEANGLALLRVYGARGLPALALPRDAAKAGDITLIGIPEPREQDGTKTLAEIKAKLADGAAIALSRPVPMAGFAGAAAIDGQGRFAGIMETSTYALASTQPALPPVRLVGAAAIRDFLARNNVTPADAATDPRKAALRIICVRK